jgi:hypothetical protein
MPLKVYIFLNIEKKAMGMLQLKISLQSSGFDVIYLYGQI